MLQSSEVMFEGANKALESFTEWGKPWLFIDNALGIPGLSEQDREAIRVVWAEAINEQNWQSDNLETHTAAADRRLQIKCPWLTPLAREEVIRAASYQWR
jgi:hypothetical protein